jgi:hypothetical protein
VFVGARAAAQAHSADKPAAHFLHLGKTGGTAIKAALDPYVDAGPYTLHLHPHWITLRDIPRGDPFFFAVRDPIDRFVSGFYSRQRQGQPRHDEPWTPEEEEAFRRFTTANELALTLSARGRQRRDAERAMKSIEHVRDSYWNWFGSKRRLVRRQYDVLYILSQSQLDVEFDELVRRLGLDDARPQLPDDDLAAHRTPTDVDRDLSHIARRNLRSWYAPDYKFITLCNELKALVGPSVVATPPGSRI